MEQRHRINLGRFSLASGLVLCALALGPVGALAQDAPATKGLTVNLDEDGSVWNLYGEIRKTVYHGSDWPGSVLDTAVRINLSYAFPM